VTAAYCRVHLHTEWPEISASRKAQIVHGTTVTFLGWHLRAGHRTCSWEVSDTQSVTKQCNLVLAKGRWCFAAGKVTMDLVENEFAGKTEWSTPERLRGEVLTTRHYTNLRLHLLLVLRPAVYRSILMSFAAESVNLKASAKKLQLGCQHWHYWLTTVGSWALPVSGPWAWNELPKDIVCAPSPLVVWYHPKDFLFRKSCRTTSLTLPVVLVVALNCPEATLKNCDDWLVGWLLTCALTAV